MKPMLTVKQAAELTGLSQHELKRGIRIVRHVVMYIGNGQIIGANGGDQSTNSPARARMRNAMVKVQPIDYGPPVYFGRTVS